MIEAYLRDLEKALKGRLPAVEVDEIVAEIRTHLTERSKDEGAARALVALGPARDLAALYLVEKLAGQAVTRPGPLRVLQAVYRMAGLSFDAAIALALALGGYLLGALFVAAALLRPFAPGRVGLWIEDASDGPNISLGITRSPPGQEILGWWNVPIGLLLGAGLLFLTWRFSLAAVRRLGAAAGRRSHVQ
jgi:hypothetical protein